MYGFGMSLMRSLIIGSVVVIFSCREGRGFMLVQEKHCSIITQGIEKVVLGRVLWDMTNRMLMHIFKLKDFRVKYRQNVKIKHKLDNSRSMYRNRDKCIYVAVDNYRSV